MKRQLILICIILLQSCAWMETEIKTVDLIGNIKILTASDDMSEGVKIIELDSSPRSMTPLIKMCKLILLDSTNAKVFIKSMSFDDQEKFSLIEFKKVENQTSYEINEISKTDFILNSNQCNNCKFFDYSK